MNKTLFSNLKKIVLDRLTGKLIMSNNPLEPMEAFYSYEQTIPSNIWNINHNYKNINFLIDVFVEQPDGSYTKVTPYQIIIIDYDNIFIDFGTEYVKGFVSLLFIENDITITEITPTPSPSTTPTPTPTLI